MVEEARKHFTKTIEAAGGEYAYLLRHLPQAEKWAKRLLKEKPEAGADIVLTAVWLHDIGQVVGEKGADHAVNSEKEARRFLAQLGAADDLIEKVADCVRAHRCKDVLPQTIEAKIVAVADSASHMTDIVYVDMASRGNLEEAVLKLERDYRDVSLFPKLKEELAPLYQAWKNLLIVWTSLWHHPE